MTLHSHIARTIVALYPQTRVAAVDIAPPHVLAALGKNGQLVFRGCTHPYADDIILSAPGQEDIKVPMPITLAQARARLTDEVTLRKTDGEYRVNVRGGTEASAYYTNDLWDAINTGEVMRDNRNDPHWQRTAHGVYRAGKASAHWSIEQGVEFWSAYVGTHHQGTFSEHDERRHPCGTALEDAMKSCDKPRLAPNDVHDHMIALGYVHTYTAPDFDDGDAENGPGTGGHDEFDTYEDADEYIIFVRGEFKHHQLVDKEMERALMGAQS
jgi:hypothetical protein